MGEEDIYGTLEPDEAVTDAATYTSYSSSDGGDTGYEGSIEDIYDSVDNQQEVEDARPELTNAAYAVRNVQLIVEGRKDSTTSTASATPAAEAAAAAAAAAAAPPGDVSRQARQKSKLWRDSSVKATSLAAQMDKKAVVQQECIHEFIYSERAYVDDVTRLKHVFVDQLHAQKLLEHEKWFPAWREAVNKLVAEGSRFLKDLEQEQSGQWIINDSSTSFLVYSRTLMGCTDPFRRGRRKYHHQWSSRGRYQATSATLC